MKSDSMFNEEQIAAGQNKIVLKSIYKTKHTVQPAFDPKSGWWAGVKRISDDDKKSLSYYITVGKGSGDSERNTTLVLEDGMEFDLANERDAINWEWVQHCKEVANSFEEAQKSKVAMFYVFIEGKEAQKDNARTNEKFEALSAVMADSPVHYENRALLLGNDMIGEEVSVIKRYLLDMAENEPKRVLDAYKSKTLQTQLLFLQAKRAGKIEEVNGVIKYGMHILGVSDDSAIAFLQNPENRELMKLIEREINPEYFEEEEDTQQTTTNNTEEVVEEATEGNTEETVSE